MSDFSAQIDDLIEYKKLVVKLEETIKSKDSENTKILQVNSDLKNLINEMKKELNNQNQKILQQYSDIKNISKNYENKIKSLIEIHENEKQKYDEKIQELSAYNPKNQETKIKNELESKYKNIIKNKDLQISHLNNEINELKENLELTIKELNILKENFNEQLNTERETHSYQIKDLISKLSQQTALKKADEEKEILQELKLSNKYNDEKTERLYKELDILREEKVQNEIKYNKDLFELDNELKEANDKNKIMQDDINNTVEEIKKIKMNFIDKEQEIDNINEINKKLIKEKESLKIIIQEKEQEIQEQIKGLKQLKTSIKISKNELKVKIEENDLLHKKIIELEEKLKLSRN